MGAGNRLENKANFACKQKPSIAAKQACKAIRTPGQRRRLDVASTVVPLYPHFLMRTCPRPLMEGTIWRTNSMNVWMSMVQIFTAQLVAVGLLVLFAKHGGWPWKGLPEPRRALPRPKRKAR